MVIAIDAGHGGKDTGAIGPGHLQEKRVVLSIARRLYRLVNAEPGMRAVMTRNGDYYVGLRERLNIARKAKADLFIAIHADAYRNPRSHGASVYALSERGASSEAARWLAEKENYSELGGVNLAGKDNLLRSVLIDLSQTATTQASVRLGEDIIQHLGHFATLHHSHVELAPFVVLKSPDIPSILIETGFISNPREAKRLREPQYQQKLAHAIKLGVRRYFMKKSTTEYVFC